MYTASTLYMLHAHPPSGNLQEKGVPQVLFFFITCFKNLHFFHPGRSRGHFKPRIRRRLCVRCIRCMYTASTLYSLKPTKKSFPKAAFFFNTCFNNLQFSPPGRPRGHFKPCIWHIRCMRCIRCIYTASTLYTLRVQSPPETYKKKTSQKSCFSL